MKALDSDNIAIEKTTSNQDDTDSHLIVIDGYGFVFRAYHALPGLTCPKGDPVGAVFGFTSMLLKLLEEMKATHVVVVFDSGSKTFRNDIYPEYKAHRPPAPDDLRSQFPLIRDAAKAMNIYALEQKGYEADDIIATLAKRALENNERVTIVSSDKDLMQLIDGKIKMFDPLKSKYIGKDEVVEKFGVTPDKLLSVLALMGDRSDNIPGIPGFGPKTAAELINQFGSLDGLLANYGQIKQDRRKKLIEDNIESAKISYKLVSLASDVVLDIDLSDLIITPPDREILFSFLDKYGFKRLTTRAEKFFNTKHDNHQKDAEISLVSVNQILSHAMKTGKISFDFDGTSWWIASDEKSIAKLENNELELIKPILSDDSVLKIAHNIKQLMKELKLDITSYYDDIMLLSYLVNNGLNKHDLASLFEKYCGVEFIARKPMVGYFHTLHSILKTQLFENNLVELYEKFERGLSNVLYKMEKAGVKIDLDRLKILSDEFAIKISKTEASIYAQAGCEFNIGSPKQLSQILFEKLGLTPGKTKKTGNISTDADTLEQLSYQGHVIADDILAWRHFSKLKSTYIDALPKQVNEITGRVHTNFSMAVTTTGRLSSNNPNLQNIPIRTLEGTKIRESFIAEENYQLISADYSQVELRILADIADIGSLKSAFKENKDIHAITAAKIFGIPIDEVTSDMRRKAKAINFGIIYGISSFGLAKQLEISNVDAAKYIEAYFKEYPGIELYMKNTKQFAFDNGYVSTLFGRKCFTPNIKDKNGAIRAFAQRAAINAPIQGTAADIIKKAMIKLDQLFLAQNLKTKMILQVHDELLFEAPLDEVDLVSNLVKKTMENIVSLSVPLIVDVRNGYSWADIH